MRKNVFGRQLKRDKNERKALFKGLISSLILHGRIKTTEEKAKAIKGQIDKVITKAKKAKVGTNARLGRYLTNDALKKLTNEVIPSLTGRNSGYTRITRLGQRFSDGASTVILEWVDTIENRKLKIEDRKEIEEKPKRVRKVKKEKNEK